MHTENSRIRDRHAFNHSIRSINKLEPVSKKKHTTACVWVGGGERRRVCGCVEECVEAGRGEGEGRREGGLGWFGVV